MDVMTITVKHTGTRLAATVRFSSRAQHAFTLPATAAMHASTALPEGECLADVAREAHHLVERLLAKVALAAERAAAAACGCSAHQLDPGGLFPAPGLGQHDEPAAAQRGVHQTPAEPHACQLWRDEQGRCNAIAVLRVQDVTGTLAWACADHYEEAAENVMGLLIVESQTTIYPAGSFTT